MVRISSAGIVLVLLLSLTLLTASPAQAQTGRSGRAITTGTLLDEMSDMAGLARMPDPPYTTVQFSSYDRRSVSPEAAGWYSNSDGFGRYEGDAYRFLARKSEVFLERAGLNVECGDAFCQQDADYLPIPFRRSLRVTWQGPLDALHFYHLEVRRYERGTRVTVFDPQRDPITYEQNLRRAVERLTRPATRYEGEVFSESVELAPGTEWERSAPSESISGAITEFRLRLSGPDMEEALRGTLLRIVFDGAGRPQVEAPVGDFFGSGPGVNPFDSLPMSVAADGTMTCRFVMPFRERVVIKLLNTTGTPVGVSARVTVSPWDWDERSLYLRAKWRTDNEVDLRSGPLDMPYMLVRGQGRLVGAAVMVVNPSAVPTPGGNWWGEGDEKIFVDDEPFPSFFGTGSEDYFNYSWSRPDLFDHPYGGQPLDSGPGNLGYVSNHRWHILDAVSFQRNLAFYIELWHHSAFPGLCYSRMAYLYGRPGALDDHRRIQLAELVVPGLPCNEPQSRGGARNSTFHHFEQLDKEVTGGTLHLEEVQPGASRRRLLCWYAARGDRLRVSLPVAEEGEYGLNMVAAHWPESGVLRIVLDGVPLLVDNLGGAGAGERGHEEAVFRSSHARRLLSTGFQTVTLAAGEHELVVECLEAGRFAFDYLWIQKR